MGCDHGIDVGAYALRALGDEEAAAFSRHLATCGECRHELEQLQAVADQLPIAAPQLEPPQALRDRIMRDVRAEADLLAATGPELDRPPARRRARRWQRLMLRPGIAMALSCTLVAVGIGAGAVLRGDDGPSSRSVPARVAMTGAQASLRISGERATLHVEGMPEPRGGGVYQVWFVKSDGRPIPTHTLFNVRKDGHASVQIDEPITGVRQILVTAEPSGGSDVPSGAPLISARPV